MATLVLSTVGSVAAGPVGGLLGTLVGQAIDQQLIGGGPRRGPRLGDLSIQGSSYGAMIPRVYGSMRVAGTIVWATDLKEVESLQGDGKSGPETVAYAYSASFAVALSSRPASRVARIWADGKLIRGSAGDMKVGGTFRFLDGSEDQSADPMIASIEGIGSTPAYRGLALAVFEDLELGPFGNRIPNLTFETIATEGGERLGALLADSSDGLIQSDATQLVEGYALYGPDTKSAIEPLVEVFSLNLVDGGGRLRDTSQNVRFAPKEETGASSDAEFARIERARRPSRSLPSILNLTYHDSSLDFQTGLARASIPANHQTIQSLAIPIVSNATQAKGLAEAVLQRRWAERERLTVRLPDNYLDLIPGERLELEEASGQWMVESVSIERMTVVAQLRPIVTSIGGRPADPGRPVNQPDIVASPSRLFLLDLSDVGELAPPSLQLAVTSPTGNYRAVPIEVSVGGTIRAAMSAAREAVTGTIVQPLRSAPIALEDLVSIAEVKLTNADHWLESCDGGALANGENLAAIGNEIVQFGDAVPLGNGRFRISRLLRGRGGTEWAVGHHVPDEAFVLLDPKTLVPIFVQPGQVGSELQVTALGVANAADPPRASREISAEAARPLAPCHLAAKRLPDGALDLSWVGRSRSAWAWLDEVEAVAEPDFQGFRVTISGDGGTAEMSSYEPRLTLEAADVESLGPSLTISVRQAGTIGLSRPATTIHSTNEA